jgi:hypothetical protein
LVQPLSNLIATDQIQGGDLIRVDYGEQPGLMTFFQEGAGLEFHHMAEIVESSGGPLRRAASVAAINRDRRPAARSGQKM